MSDLKNENESQIENQNDLAITDDSIFEEAYNPSGAESDNNSEGEVDKTKTKKSKIKIIILILVLLTFSFSGFAYYLGQKVADSDDGLLDIMKKGVSETTGLLGSGNSETINYGFYFDSNYSFKDDGVETASGELSLKNGKIYSSDGGLKQRFQIGELAGNISYENYQGLQKSEFDIKNLDIISDNEKVYLFIEQGVDKVIELIENNSTSTISADTTRLNEYKNTFESGNYVMVDNSKPILKVFGELAKNELMKEFLVGLVTSNPKSYYSEKGIDEKLVKYLQSDKVIDYLFVNGETDTTTNKTALSINTQVCNDYAPVIVAAVSDIGEPYSELSPSSEAMISQCEMIITQTNSILPMLTQIYKQGDLENGNFDLKIAQGNLVDISISYADHYLSTWYVSIKEPQEQFKLLVSGDNEKILSSNLVIDIENEMIAVKGEVVDGEGSITMNSDMGEMGKLDGIIEFSKYLVSTYDIEGSSNTMGIISDLKAKGTLLVGDIVYKSTWEDEVLASAKLSYAKNTYNLDLYSELMELSSSYKDKKFSFDFKEKYDTEEVKQSFSFLYDNTKVTGSMQDRYNNLVLDGEIKSLKEFELTITNPDNKNSSTVIKGIVNSETNNIYSLVITEDSKKIIDANLSIENTEVEGYDEYNYNLKFLLLDDGEIVGDLDTQFKLGYKESEADYIIPENITESDIKIHEIYTIPDFNEVNKLNRKEYILGGATAGAVVGTISYISLQGYAAEARNSKRYSDLSTIARTISIAKIRQGDEILSSIVKYDMPSYAGEDIYVGGNKLVLGENYFVGTIDFDLLNLSSNDFKDPNGTDYIIGITTENGGSFQILGIIEGDKYNTAKINTTYTSRDSGYKGTLTDIPTIGDSSITVTNETLEYFRAGDLTNYGTIEKKIINKNLLIFDKSIEKISPTIYLIHEDTSGLIFMNGEVVKEGDILN